MKKPLLFISIALFSLASIAKVGDTYICEMGEHYSTERLDMSIQKRDLESFTFERGGNYIKISSKEKSGFASGLFDVYSSTEAENFKAKGWQTLISYSNNLYGGDIKEYGFFNYVQLHNARGITGTSAICHILK